MRRSGLAAVFCILLAGCGHTPAPPQVDQRVASVIPPAAALEMLKALSGENGTSRKWRPELSFSGCGYESDGVFRLGTNQRRRYQTLYLFFDSMPGTPETVAYVTTTDKVVKAKFFNFDTIRESFLKEVARAGGCLVGTKWYSASVPARDEPEWINRLTTAWLALGGKLGTKR